MEIKYNDLEKEAYKIVSKNIFNLMFIHLILTIVLSIPAIIGIFMVFAFNNNIVGVCFIIGGAFFTLIGVMSSLYSVKIYIKSRKKNYIVIRTKVVDIAYPDDVENTSIYKISIDDSKRQVMFINTVDNIMIEQGMEVDVISNVNGNPMFAIPQINICKQE